MQIELTSFDLDLFCAQLGLAIYGTNLNSTWIGLLFQDANCGNILLLSLEELVKDGLLMSDELPDPV